jgi:sec-independent protein translocase protein TatC
MADSLPTMSFGEHLEVLRRMLWRLSAVLIVLMSAIFLLKDQVFSLLLAPKEYDFVTFRAIEQLLHAMGSTFSFEPYHVSLINTELSGQFMAHLSTSFYLAVLLASPYLLAEVFAFILPALYANERHYAVRVGVLMYVLFAVGVLMNYFVLFPISFRFLGTYQVSDAIENTITLGSYISTFSTLTFMMGLVFQLPLVSWFLGKVGILTARLMRQYRRHAFVGIMFLAAVITPPDLFTLLLVTVPLYLLYEISIWVVPEK